MTRKNFISKEFFVSATEQQIKETLLHIPQHISNIKLVDKHTPAQTVKFLYEREETNLQFYVDVSLLRLDQEYTSVCMHITYANGQVFTKDSNIILSLNNFESAIQCGLKGELSNYQPLVPKPKPLARFAHTTMMVAASAGMLFMSRKLS